jgi:hypothetical protein
MLDILFLIRNIVCILLYFTPFQNLRVLIPLFFNLGSLRKFIIFGSILHEF